MIIVKLCGGLGNQLFQYALGKSLSIASKLPLKLDINAFKKDTLRKYYLNNFTINEELATQKEIVVFKNNIFLKAINKLTKNKFHYLNHIVNEKNICFEPQILKIKKKVYLDGYWQTEKYFKDIENILKKEFVLKTPLNAKNKKTLERISVSLNSVALHIRRGDYVNNTATSQFHGNCSLQYYQNAINLISEKIKDPHFFIFSDDIPWVKENLKSKYPMYYLDNNPPEKGYEDLRLMSGCKHFIIANSSFSWWGAWLAENKNKIVIAPKKWFNDTSIDTKDLIPETWLKI
jgi:glycosyl transferase family 11